MDLTYIASTSCHAAHFHLGARRAPRRSAQRRRGYRPGTSRVGKTPTGRRRAQQGMTLRPCRASAVDVDIDISSSPAMSTMILRYDITPRHDGRAPYNRAAGTSHALWREQHMSRHDGFNAIPAAVADVQRLDAPNYDARRAGPHSQAASRHASRRTPPDAGMTAEVNDWPHYYLHGRLDAL